MGGHLQGGRQRRCLEVVEVGGKRRRRRLCCWDYKGVESRCKNGLLLPKKNKKKKAKTVINFPPRAVTAHSRTHAPSPRTARPPKKKKNEWIATV